MTKMEYLDIINKIKVELNKIAEKNEIIVKLKIAMTNAIYMIYLFESSLINHLNQKF